MARPAHLPEFSRPPVTEVAMGFQFDDIGGFEHIHVGELWGTLKDRFDERITQPPIAPQFEVFGQFPRAFGGHLELLNAPPLPRFLFRKSSGGELVQFQTSRFVHNWLKTGEGDHYPRYEHIRSQFLEEIERLRKLLARLELPDLAINQCELSYINQIPIPQDMSPSDVFSAWSGVSHPQLGAEEDVAFRQRFIIRGDDGVPIGRLMTDVQLIAEPTGQTAYRLSITSRGKPQDATVEAAIKFLDAGREQIVMGFDACTTPAMHMLWGKQSP